ncbi:MAG: PAS domain S-box protein [Dehalococcoidia bacterium]
MTNEHSGAAIPVIARDDQGREELIRLLLDSTGEGIYGIDLDGKCTFANPACLKLLGFSDESELLGKQMHELVHHTRPSGEPYPVEQCRIYQAFRKNEGTHVDDECMWCADGTSFLAEYWSYPVIRDGELMGTVVTFVDITERKRVESELVETEQLVRLLLNSSGEGIYGTDMDGNCTFANPAALELLGFAPDTDLIGKQMHELVHHTRPNGDRYPVEQCRIYRAFRNNEGTHVDDECMWCADGTSFPAEYWSYPVTRDGELMGTVVTFVDITERRKTEEELRQSEKLSALGKMSAGLAHELNNPAAAAARASEQMRLALGRLDEFTIALSGHGLSDEHWASLRALRERLSEDAGGKALGALDRADLEAALGGWLESRGVDEPWDFAFVIASAGLNRDELESTLSTLPDAAIGDAIAWAAESRATRELAETIVQSTASISELVSAVKQYSYMDQAPQQELDIHDGLESTLTMLGHKLKSGPTVVREYDRSLPKILTAGGELNQVWTNILDNAIDAAGTEGEIRIITGIDGDDLLVEFVDNGPGIPRDLQSRVFDPFFTTKDVGEGTGLGLDISRRIITERCGGQINVTSEPGHTRFQVRLPTGRE